MIMAPRLVIYHGNLLPGTLYPRQAEIVPFPFRNERLYHNTAVQLRLDADKAGMIRPQKVEWL